MLCAEDANLLIMSAVTYQTLALSSSGQCRDTNEPWEDDLDEDGASASARARFFSTASAAFLGLSSLVSDGLRGPYNQWKKCDMFFEIALSWPDRDFRSEFRVSRVTFDRLVCLLEQDPIFYSTGKKPQRPVRYQLACFLMRYGTRGADSLQVAHKLGIGFGSVFTYCHRVVRALRTIGLQVVSWGDDERRKVVSDYIFDHYGFPQCLGILDGSLIRLTQMPEKAGFTFICRKKYPAINIQAIVDHQKRFISFDLGWPGSVADVMVWKKSQVWQRRLEYFSGNSQVLADKGYPSSPYVLRPFTEPEVDSQPLHEKLRRRKFNKRLSSIRIYVEHAFGMLKGRFPALKDLPPEQDIQDTYRLMEALLALHNICIDFEDLPERIPFYDPADHDNGTAEDDEGLDISLSSYGGVSEGDVLCPAWETDEWLKEAGHRRRLQILDDLFPLN